MAKEEQFQHESLQDSKTIAKYLQALIDGFEKGEISLNSDQGNIRLIPNDLMELTIKAKKKGDKSKLSLKVSWKDTPVMGSKSDSIFIGS